MSFSEQTAKILSGTAEYKFRAVIFGRDAFYLEGARPIKIDETQMIFKVAGAVMEINGSGMSVKELAGDCVSVIGRIAEFKVNDL